jgi:hypothetical protein
MNSRRPQGEGPDGLPSYVWTDEAPDPTTFAGPAVKGERSESAGHERSECP